MLRLMLSNLTGDAAQKLLASRQKPITQYDVVNLNYRLIIHHIGEALGMYKVANLGNLAIHVAQLHCESNDIYCRYKMQVLSLSTLIVSHWLCILAFNSKISVPGRCGLVLTALFTSAR